MTAYLAPEKYVLELSRELNNITHSHDRLILTSSKPQETIWSQLVIKKPQTLPIESINHAVKILKSHGRFWANYSFCLHRRSKLIEEQLPTYKIKPLEFLGALPTHPIGFWSLINSHTLFFSEQTSSPFPLGEIHFAEDKKNPPSRAYLKLWEIMTVHQIRPRKNERVLDLGSSPGGWTWVLQQLGCQVISIDKAPLHPSLLKLPNVKYIKKDAFSINPSDIGAVDWLFSDIIGYPQKIYELIMTWHKSNLCKNFVCTIKFQGPTDFTAIQLLQKIPDSRMVHLFNNKHEVTFILQS